MVKDAKVGKSLHSGGKKTTQKHSAIAESCSFVEFFSEFFCFKYIPLVSAPDSYSAMNFGQLPGRIGMNRAFTQAGGMGKLLVSLPRVPGCVRPTAVQDSPSPIPSVPTLLEEGPQLWASGMEFSLQPQLLFFLQLKSCIHQAGWSITA